MSGSLFIVSAASGTGKTSLVQALRRDQDRLRVSISHTTRAPRPGEEDGVHYHFTDHARFEAAIAAGEFLEHARVFGQLYGTSRRSVETLLAADFDVLLEIDWQGAAQIKRLFAASVAIFILPPSLDALAERLRKRAQDSDSVIAERLQQAQDDMRHCREFDYIIVNDDFEQALADLCAVTAAARLRQALQCQRQASLLQNLLSKAP